MGWNAIRYGKACFACPTGGKCDGFVLDAGPQVELAPCCVHIRARIGRAAASLSVTGTGRQGELAFPYPDKGFWALSAPTNHSVLSNRTLFLKVPLRSLFRCIPSDPPRCECMLLLVGFLGPARLLAPSGCSPHAWTLWHAGASRPDPTRLLSPRDCAVFTRLTHGMRRRRTARHGRRTNSLSSKSTINRSFSANANPTAVRAGRTSSASASPCAHAPLQTAQQEKNRPPPAPQQAPPPRPPAAPPAA